MYDLKRSDSIGTLVATIIFSIVAIGQLARSFTDLKVMIGSLTVPVWVSRVAGSTALIMAFWMGTVYKHVRTSK